VARLEDEAGLGLADLVDDFADTAAFMDYVNETSAPGSRDGVAVYPVSSVIWQDTRTLVTTATVTTVVQADFETLRVAVDPRRWPVGNDVVTKTTLVADPFARSALSRDESPPEGAGWRDQARFVEETAQIFWGGDPTRQATFENVLYVRPFAVQPDAGRIDLSFSLSRSVRSRVLWDERPGGIVLDSGYIKVRPLVDNRWRVTRRKVVKFSDRTPYTDGRGWLDFGQMLNYLAPAALAYWLENDIASLEIPADG
jgi:hypothetical protein